jgi:hypothetical protein
MEIHRMRIANALLAVGLAATLAAAGCTGGSMGSGTGVPAVGRRTPAAGTTADIQHGVKLLQ